MIGLLQAGATAKADFTVGAWGKVRDVAPNIRPEGEDLDSEIIFLYGHCPPFKDAGAWAIMTAAEVLAEQGEGFEVAAKARSVKVENAKQSIIELWVEEHAKTTADQAQGSPMGEPD